MSAVTVEPWPNQYGHTVLIDGKLVAEVFDWPERKGVKIATFDNDGQKDLVLDYPEKVAPLKAVSLAFVLGKPLCELREAQYDVAKLKKKHGKHAVLILEESDGSLVARHHDMERLDALGVPEKFDPKQLEDFSLRLIGEGLKVVLCQPDKGGGE